MGRAVFEMFGAIDIKALSENILLVKMLICTFLITIDLLPSLVIPL